MYLSVNLMGSIPVETTKEEQMVHEDCPLLGKCKLAEMDCQSCGNNVDSISRIKDIRIREANVASLIRHLVGEQSDKIEHIYRHGNQVVIIINGHHFLVQVHEVHTPGENHESSDDRK